MKAIFKNFIHVLKQFKTASVLNILGLSAAFMVFTVTMLQVYYDVNFNAHFKNKDEIFLHNVRTDFDGRDAIWISTPRAKRFAEKAPQIEAYAIVEYFGTADFLLKDNTRISEEYLKVSPGFVDLFNPTVLEGNLAETLTDPAKVAMSESVALKFFGTKNAVGQTVRYFNSGGYTQTVGAILKDFPKGSIFKNGVYTYQHDDEEDMANYNLYYLVRKANQKAFEETIHSDEFLGADVLKSFEEDPYARFSYRPVLFSDIHLHFPLKGGGNFGITMAMLAIGFIIIGIAFINYINFSISMAPARVKTLNVQNILGATKAMQRGTIICESIFFSLLAFAIALVGVYFIHSSTLQSFFSADLNLMNNVCKLIIIGAILILTAVLLGIYPAKYATSFQPTDAIKGSALTVINSSKLRNVLITIQFVAAISLIITSTFIKLQHDYMLNYSWGIQKENIIYFSRAHYNGSIEAFCDELLKNPRITDYTTSCFAPGYVLMGWGRQFKGKQILIASWPVRENYLDFFGVKMAAGENFTKEGENVEKIIFNEDFLRKYEFDTSIIGDSLDAFGHKLAIVGIAQDINFESLKMPIRPMAFVTIKSQKSEIIFLKLTGEDIPATIEDITHQWDKVSKEPIQINFLDSQLASLYKTENNLSKLIGIFSLITVLIAIMGVYGIITFNSRYRAKEIAIRKVQGSTGKEIMLLLNKSMFIQFAIGFVLAVPIAYFVVDKWLEQFAYKVTIHWWVFPLGGIIVLLTTLITVSIQSYRAASVNPTTILKNE